SRGIIAAGHAVTAEAAAEVMAAGGNAFDGACAALATAAVAEPVLASLGGGGFLMARPAGGEPVLFDFFVQTPRQGSVEAASQFFPIVADFGDTTQTFHIGAGSMATPGAVAGLFVVQQALCRLPIADLLVPAQRAAREGVTVSRFQHRLARVVEPILRAHPDCFAVHASDHDAEQLAAPGERVRQPQLAEALAELAEVGAGLLYGERWNEGVASSGAGPGPGSGSGVGSAAGPSVRSGAGGRIGSWGEQLTQYCARAGGLLSTADLAQYRVERRAPLKQRFQGAELFLNPSPSFGGVLIALTLELLQEAGPSSEVFGSFEQRQRLALAMRLTQEARNAAGAQLPSGLASDLVASYREQMRARARVWRGTTQVSIADAEGNLASLTLSNGEGAGVLLPGTGIMMNNMLGEEDLNPNGVARFPLDQRMSSMMCPTLIRQPRSDAGPGKAPCWIVTGSAGSNRIRSAILQVLSNLLELGMPLAEAVEAPRLHLEGDLLSLEPPVEAPLLKQLQQYWPEVQVWRDRSVFFGGAHSVAVSDDGCFSGAGDSRRGGVVRAV
ncbi:gamma-glutamyltransferase, partial [Halochromatium sp.]